MDICLYCCRLTLQGKHLQYGTVLVGDLFRVDGELYLDVLAIITYSMLADRVSNGGGNGGGGVKYFVPAFALLYLVPLSHRVGQ